MARIFDRAQEYAESPKGRVRVTINFAVTYELDTQSGNRRVEYTTTVKEPKMLGEAQQLYRRGGQFQIGHDPRQMPLGVPPRIDRRDETQDSQGETDAPTTPAEAGTE